jgi:DNA-directed RNA polymerase subunit RPC12/RpoP
MTECPACGADSELCYRCSECGRDLAGDTETTDGGGRR